MAVTRKPGEDIELESVSLPAQIQRQESNTTHPNYSSQYSYVQNRRARESRMQSSSKWSFKRSVADFFGVGDECPEEQLKWLNRSVRLASKRSVGGQVKPEMRFDAHSDVDSLSLSYSSYRSFSPYCASATPTPYDPLHLPKRQDSRVSRASAAAYMRQMSNISWGRRSTKAYRRPRKDSAVKVAYDGLKGLVVPQRSNKGKPEPHSRSFTPNSISQYCEEIESARQTPTVDSVFTTGDDSFLDDVFFDSATPTSPLARSVDSRHLPVVRERRSADEPLSVSTQHLEGSEFNGCPIAVHVTDDEDNDQNNSASVNLLQKSKVWDAIMRNAGNAELHIPDQAGDQEENARPKQGWRKSAKLPSPHPDTPDNLDQVDHPLADVAPNLLKRALKKSKRKREIGKGMIGMCFDRQYNDDRLDENIQQQMDDIDDHRPYFTYWVTFVQIVSYIFTIASYGVAPLGFEETEISGVVMTTNLAREKVSYFEKDNFWFGPRQADLIHLGAKFSPCMRRDENVQDALLRDRRIENASACCIYNDGSGCYQSNSAHCSATLAKFLKWDDHEKGPEGRTSGSVCGLDPRFCERPLSSGAFKWENDITKWPICEKTKNASGKGTEHMQCEVVGRPCCIGIQGECIITTRDHCTFLRGYFHETAKLCSQVSCLDKICGMFPFVDPERPDQFYRLWTCLFIHAGALQLCITVFFQMFIMRDLEKLAGCIRIGIIYLGSGIAGSLSSGIFLPYHVEAGPAGCIFGLLGCLFVEVFQNWYILEHPWWSVGKLAAMLLSLFIIGLLPMVDNYAHVIGFVFGILLSFALLPYVTFGKFDRRRKLVGIVVSLLIAFSIMGLLIVLFYISPVYDCPYCHYFNCIPLSEKFCESMEVVIRRAFH